MAQILMLRKAHFFSLDNDLIDVHAKVIGSTALSVYVALARFVNRKTGECWPSIGRLASLLDLARNTVKAALRTLEAAGLIAIRRRRDPAGDATSHLYTLLDASPAAVQIRLAQRHRAAVEAPETGRAPDDPPPSAGGRSGDDPPPVTPCSTGGSPIDQEPLSSQPEQENQPDARTDGAGKDTPQAPTKAPCPHPVDERRQFGELTLCTHCYTMVNITDETTLEDTQPGREGQADASAA